MVIWCAFCQRFAGERPPLDENLVSHGICDACSAKDPAALSAQIASVRPVMDLMQHLWQLGLTGTIADVPAVVAKARALNMQPTDLVVGLIAPLLTKLGKRWQEGSVTIAEEHRFTAFFESVIHQVRLENAPLRERLDAEHPQVLLVNCDDNSHTVGLRVAEVWLAEQGITSRVVVPGLPTAEAVALVEQVAPLSVGLSVSMPDQLPAVQDLLARLAQSPTRCGVLVGGYAVKSGQLGPQDLPGATLVPQLLDLTAHLPALRAAAP